MSANVGGQRSKEASHSVGVSKLLWAVTHDQTSALEQLLIENKELVNDKDYDGRTALHVAASHGHVRSAEVLLRHGAAVNELDRRKNSPLHDAIENEKEDVRRLLERHGGKDLGGKYADNQGIKAVPPKPHRADWEIDPKEIDLSVSELIGKGSFGEIRKATWRGTPVAVKKILPALSNDELVVTDFCHEVNLLVRIRHPNCVQFLGAVTKEKPLLLVTEYLSGGDLHRVLKERYPLKTSHAIHFALDMARGIAYLHSGTKGVIIHRDLKPRNILVGDGDLLKVGDFGLSKLVQTTSLHDMYKLTGETGSYRYMAPEVFEHAQYDSKVDVFSFAMILYEMFEGHPPFEHVDPYDAARIVAKFGQRPTFKADYPEHMKELIECCWKQSAAERPPFTEIINKLDAMAGNFTPREHSRHHLLVPLQKIQTQLHNLNPFSPSSHGP